MLKQIFIACAVGVGVLSAEVAVIRSDSRDVLDELKSQGLTVDFVDNGYLGVSGTASQINLVTQQYPVISQASEGRAGYPSYNEVISELQEYASNYSDICSYSVVGKSTNGRDVGQLLIDIDSSTPKPLIMITGTTHGNEKVGSENVRYMLDKIFTGYGADGDIMTLLQTYRLKVIPVMSPDGYVNHSRYVNGYTDPNREFGWQVGYYNGQDQHNVVSFPFKDSEMKAYRDVLIEEPWFAGLDYHTGVEAVIVPWFSDVPMEPVDKSEFTTISNSYLANITLDKGLQFGGWMEYQGMPGIQGDYPYSRCGTMSLVMETHNSQTQTPPGDINQVNQNNYRGFIALTTAANTGISGVVVNESNEPLYCRVTPPTGFAVYSSPRNGAFFKHITKSGSKSVEIFANGYTKKSVSLTAGDGFSPEEISLSAAPEQKYAAMTIEYLRCYNRPKQADMHKCLELGDGEGLLIQSGNSHESHLLVDFGEATPVTDQDGDDLTVIASGNGSYQVFGSADMDDLDFSASGFLIGEGSGTESFDLKSVAMDSIRFIKLIIPKGESITLDAIEATPIPSVSTLPGNIIRSSMVTLFSRRGAIEGSLNLPLGEYSLSLTNIHGRLVAPLVKGVTTTATLKKISLGVDLAPGIYFVKLKVGDQVSTFSVPMI